MDDEAKRQRINAEIYQLGLARRLDRIENTVTAMAAAMQVILQEQHKTEPKGEHR